MGYLYQWAPYLIYGLSKGSHRIKMELVNPQNELVSGDFNQAERIINVK